MERIILTGIELIILIAAFLIGRYIMPKLKDAVDLDKLAFLSTWAYNFVVEAKNLLVDADGPTKKKVVTGKIRTLCKKYGIDITSEQISALIENAYSSMKEGEKIADKN